MTMSDTLIDKCIHSVNTFTSSQQDKYVSRQDKSGLIFPPCIAEKFLRVYNVMVTKSSPIFLACLLENVCRNILENCENDKVRLTIRDLELAVRKNKDLNILFENCKISFLGGGVVPEIHEELLVKKIKKRKKQCEELLLDNKKIHRYRPGTVCIRQIKKLQKTSNCLTFAKIPFEKIVRSKILKYNPDLKFSKDIFIVIQYYIEQFLINFLRDCNTTAIHAGRVKLIPTDISFVNNIQKLNML